MSNADRDNLNRANDLRDGDQWEACPTGELTQLVDRLDAAQRRARSRQVYGTALASTAVFAVVVLALGSFFEPSGSNYGGINCAYCRNHLPDYYPHLTGEVVLADAEFVASMKVHLEKCTFCRSKFRSLYPDFELTRTNATRPAIAVATLPQFSVGRSSVLY